MQRIARVFVPAVRAFATMSAPRAMPRMAAMAVRPVNVAVRAFSAEVSTMDVFPSIHIMSSRLL